MQTGLCRSEPSLWPGPSPRTGRRISDARDEGPQSASGTVFVSRRDRERAITPAPNRGKSRVFRGDGELGVSAGLRGGPGRTEANKRVTRLLPELRTSPGNTIFAPRDAQNKFPRKAL